MTRFAAIDMGTNTLRLLIAEHASSANFKTVYTENRITRLGEGFATQKRIRPAAITRTLSALKHFKAILRREAAESTLVFGTSAVREAENKDAFVETVREETGFNIEVLSGEAEARYALTGAHLIFKDRENGDLPLALIDIGGGSTELIVSEDDKPPVLMSLALGAVTLTEKFLHADPPTPVQIRALQDEVDRRLRPAAAYFPKRGVLVGTAGTVTTLAAIEQRLTRYDPEKINRYCLKKDVIRRWLKLFSEKPVAAWQNLAGLEKGRETILCAGVLILCCVMDILGYDELQVSDYGLREGILMDRLINPLHEGER